MVVSDALLRTIVAVSVASSSLYYVVLAVQAAAGALRWLILTLLSHWLTLVKLAVFSVLVGSLLWTVGQALDPIKWCPDALVQLLLEDHGLQGWLTTTIERLSSFFSPLPTSR